ncbi:isoaspartyl peptidase/L-asparaginase [Callorhinchus milii]|uniref:Isoaspartyl peptidase/L-asparaginase n=2 Tax=Callorhinchus milii TaxID=7868 RepID=A0A4W3JFG7_CALMI|nr:isoaspartyl peptidase/L-asparaginase [Callorhinchus milii]XP_042189416.1 isoaspartyl peptidase/L-asparaginase [Callorhinchus milii]|eukprot:gi/632953180/ref/XP_007892265.1/ PREDICTED: isoaspartyl peptidase/L-asparaginase-like [Callorhinchus milii]
MKPIIVIHGGAWAIPERLVEGSMTGVKRAAREGFALLESGASAVDAVEAAVRILEDDPVFDAGHGAVLNADGDVELDAIIMDGKTLAAGAICCVKNVSNPVTLARSVMEKTDHVMLSGAGANQFAASLGIEEVSTEELVTQHAREEWGQYKYSDAVSNLFNMEAAHDTVGAVAIDAEGNLACATSTGGITNKMVGRVGDTPVIGSGGYADNQVGAVSTTGHGESILKVTLARLIIYHMEQGASPGKAADKALLHMQERVAGCGGAIVISAQGEWTAKFTTKQMAWASMEGGTLCYGLNPGEKYTEGTITK